MAFSCSSQFLQRTWRVCFRHGAFCLASTTRSQGLALRTLSLAKLRRLSPQFSTSLWRVTRSLPVLGLRNARTVSVSSLECTQGADSTVVEASPSSEHEEQARKDRAEACEVESEVKSEIKDDTKVYASVTMAGLEREEVATESTEVRVPESQSDIRKSVAEEEGTKNLLVVEEDVEGTLNAVDLFGGENDGGHGESDTVLANSEVNHPWPEWGIFLKMLGDGKHFDFDTETTDTADDKDLEDNVGRIKRASMAFARYRDDIFSFLSRKPLEVLARFGCPSTDRKVVNAGKRLRALLDIPEVSVCETCDIRTSCARAYNKPANVDAAGTSDVVRLLIGYALVGQAQIRPLPGNVEAAAKRLLVEVVTASETPRDPSLPPPASKVENKPREDKGSRMSASDQMKPGDWKCPDCSYVNFSRNIECRECGAHRPPLELPPGDWQCQECNFINFSRNTVCRQCKAGHPVRELKEGDWECPRCKFHNFARNKECYECQTARPREVGRSYDRGGSLRKSEAWSREDPRSSYGRSGDNGRPSYARSGERSRPTYERSSSYARTEERGRPTYERSSSYARSEERGRPTYDRSSSYARSEERGRPTYDRSTERGRPYARSEEPGLSRFDRDQGRVGKRRKHEEWRPMRGGSKSKEDTSRLNFDISNDSDEDLDSGWQTGTSSDEEFKELDFDSEEDDNDYDENVPSSSQGSRGRGVDRRRGGDKSKGRDISAGKSRLARSSSSDFDSGDEVEFDNLEFGDDEDDKDFVQRSPSSRGGERGQRGGRGGRGRAGKSRLARSSSSNFGSDSADEVEFDDLEFGDDEDDKDFTQRSPSFRGGMERGRRGGRGRGGSAVRSRDSWSSDAGRSRESWSSDGGRDSSRRGSGDSSWDGGRPSRGRGSGRGGRGGRSYGGRDSQSSGGRSVGRSSGRGRGGGRGGRGGRGRGR